MNGRASRTTKFRHRHSGGAKEVPGTDSQITVGIGNEVRDGNLELSGMVSPHNRSGPVIDLPTSIMLAVSSTDVSERHIRIHDEFSGWYIPENDENGYETRRSLVLVHGILIARSLDLRLGMVVTPLADQ